MKRQLSLSLITLSLFITLSCRQANETENNTIEASNNEPKDQDTLSIDTPLNEDLNTVLLEKGLAVLQTLDPLDLSKLYYYSDNKKGILLSPYLSINKNFAKHYSYDDMIAMYSSNKTINWGEYDGTGDPINLTLYEYFNRFVYDQNYRNAPLFSVDKRLSNGNSIDNTLEYFPKAHYIEFHFDQLKPELLGMDWRTIRLVFEKIANEYTLVAILHDEWTI